MSIDAQLLSILRAAGQDYVSGSELSQELGISRSMLRTRVEGLCELGYEIAVSPHHGYCLLDVPDLLHADDLFSRLGKTKVIGRDIQVFDKTTSTNDVVEKLARDGVKEGAVVFAEAQTKGRGRLGRKWISPPRKGLWFSVLLRPDLRPQAVTQLTIMAATALVRAIQEQSGLWAEIKWPNDLLLRGKKVAGILTELSAELDRVKWVVLGIGLNINLNAGEFAPELRPLATSLKIETGRTFDRAALAASILRELDTNYAKISGGDFESVANEWQERCATIGRNVTILIGDLRLQGRAESLDDDGALILRTQHGRVERVISGDVRLES
jgi:BirA family biotin operon repressor/biotin-[acetyl-CoA-carboxylase] ligase